MLDIRQSRCAVGIRKLQRSIANSHCDCTRMFVYGRLLARIEGDAKHTHLIILKLDFMMFRINCDRILRTDYGYRDQAKAD